MTFGHRVLPIQKHSRLFKLVTVWWNIFAKVVKKFPEKLTFLTPWYTLCVLTKWITPNWKIRCCSYNWRHVRVIELDFDFFGYIRLMQWKPFPPWSRTKRKNFWICIFTLFCGASKGFVKALKAFIKPFEASQRSVKIKI